MIIDGRKELSSKEIIITNRETKLLIELGDNNNNKKNKSGN